MRACCSRTRSSPYLATSAWATWVAGSAGRSYLAISASIVVCGASTISMQVAKNLFLWPSKSYVRKVLEVPLTMAIELLWPKKRIMEVYLNIAEWGPGIFGAEQAARHHFGKSALRLNDRESARLAVSLPNPIQRDAGHPGPGTRRLAALNMARARGTSPSVTGCILGYPPN